MCTKKHATCVHSLVCYTCAVACMPLMSCAPFYLHAACLWRISIFVYVAHKYVFVCYSYAATCMPLISSDILLFTCCMPMARFNICVCGTQALWYISACLPGRCTFAAYLPGRRGTCAACLPGRCVTCAACLPGRCDTCAASLPGRCVTCAACLPGRCGTCVAFLLGRCLVEVVHVLHVCLVDVW